ncbi:hypothetical protein D3C87_687560 [compost metagenome]
MSLLMTNSEGSRKVTIMLTASQMAEFLHLRDLPTVLALRFKELLDKAGIKIEVCENDDFTGQALFDGRLVIKAAYGTLTCWSESYGTQCYFRWRYTDKEREQYERNQA